MERIILYYSEGGKTKVVAETLALNLRCDICQIKDLKRRDGIVNRLSSAVDAFRETKTEIYPPTLDLEEYDTIYIGTPTWANNPTPAIITLIDRCDLRGKDIVLFTTSNSSEGETTLGKMEMKVRARGARVVQQFNLKVKDKSPKQLQRDTNSLFVTLDLDLY
ncbi:flavodoxin [Methanobrevibacter sp.]|uniref:flavodoxin family protein n=1 Tax=Methanobrevibacter sp. TaxID=66852 RepID=UPI0025F8ACB4|nr:flavodoxin [Methanobrevibacter sp.]MBQ2961852.1 flavodoxin [Methanobrevibacter sp.]